ncbi:MAG: hypothetical protein AAF384_13670 [Pseudomonadota bacterium]
MLTKRGKIFTPAILATFLSWGTSSVLAESIGGTWDGHYYYSDPREPVPFTLEINVHEAAFAGKTSEPNTTENPTTPHLYAAVKGTVSGQAVSFEKTYDGTDGQTHTVYYEGRIVAPDKIEGIWDFGRLEGTFELSRREIAEL